MTHKIHAMILVAGLGLWLAPSLGAAGAANPMVVEKPAPVHHFWDSANVGLHAISVALLTADVATTQRALQLPGAHEMNPLAQSQGALMVLKIAGVGAGIGISYMLHKSGHHKMERVIPLMMGVPSGLAAAHNASLRR